MTCGQLVCQIKLALPICPRSPPAQAQSSIPLQEYRVIPSLALALGPLASNGFPVESGLSAAVNFGGQYAAFAAARTPTNRN